MFDSTKQFLNSNNKFVVDFGSLEEVAEQKTKVRAAICNSKCEQEFDELDMYYQILRHFESNLVLEKNYGRDAI